MANQNPSPQEIRHRVNHFMSKLSDRDTEITAAAELSAIIRTLSADSLASFISAVGDIRSADKIPLRRHSLRLLSLLARSVPPSALSPHLPRLLATALRRLRDPDSSVRAALVDAVRSLAAAAPRAALIPTILSPLVDALFHEQDINPQSVSALSLSASLEECNRHGADELSEVSDFVLRLVPRLVKLAKKPSFKAKPAVLALLGNASITASGIGDAELRLLVNCLMEFLRSQDWAARNAAAMTLAHLASAEKGRLSGFKSSCLAAFESLRYDKVKIVRDSMNRMLEQWKEIPDKKLDADSPPQYQPQQLSETLSSSYLKEMSSDGSFPTTTTKSSSIRSSHPSTTRSKISVCKSPPTVVPRVLTLKKIETNSRKNSKLFVQKKYTDRKTEIVFTDTPPYTAEGDDKPTIMELDAKTSQQGASGNNGRSRLEVKRALFEKKWENKENGGLRSGSRVVPFNESGISEVMNEAGVAGDHEEPKEDDLSLIRMQLIQIENQQSSLLNLLQRFMGSSQNGIRSLEARVHGLEIALDDMSRDIAASGRRGSNNDQVAKMCCRLPGADIFRSKFWRRAESSYSSRLLFYKESQRFGPRGGYINPLAEAIPQLEGTKIV